MEKHVAQDKRNRLSVSYPVVSAPSFEHDQNLSPDEMDIGGHQMHYLNEELTRNGGNDLVTCIISNQTEDNGNDNKLCTFSYENNEFRLQSYLSLSLPKQITKELTTMLYRTRERIQ